MSVSFYARRVGEERALPETPSGRPNYNNGNAVAILRALGYSPDLGALAPDVPIAEFRARCLGVVNRPIDPTLERPMAVTEHSFIGGLNADGIRSRVLDLLTWAARSQRRGATTVYWG
jgi:hypothetical protein